MGHARIRARGARARLHRPTVSLRQRLPRSVCLMYVSPCVYVHACLCVCVYSRVSCSLAWSLNVCLCAFARVYVASCMHHRVCIMCVCHTLCVVCVPPPHHVCMFAPLPSSPHRYIMHILRANSDTDIQHDTSRGWGEGVGSLGEAHFLRGRALLQDHRSLSRAWACEVFYILLFV
jgi:hypothetical protein